MITQDCKALAVTVTLWTGPELYIEDCSKINDQMIRKGKASEECDNVVLDFQSCDANEKSEKDRDDLCCQTDP